MENTIIHLIGPPGVGKYTIASEIARRMGARLVDNHAIANVIFNVIAPDGVAPLPKGIWGPVGQVRAAVLDTIVQLAPAHLSYVFTNYIRGDDPAEEAVFREFVAVAEIRGATYVPVLVRCDRDELVRRVVSEDRRTRMKLVDPVQALQMAEVVPPFRTDHPNVLELDVTKVPADDAAATVIRWARARHTVTGRPHKPQPTADRD